MPPLRSGPDADGLSTAAAKLLRDSALRMRRSARAYHVTDVWTLPSGALCLPLASLHVSVTLYVVKVGAPLKVSVWLPFAGTVNCLVVFFGTRGLIEFAVAV